MYTQTLNTVDLAIDSEVPVMHQPLCTTTSHSSCSSSPLQYYLGYSCGYIQSPYFLNGVLTSTPLIRLDDSASDDEPSREICQPEKPGQEIVLAVNTTVLPLPMVTTHFNTVFYSLVFNCVLIKCFGVVSLSQ